MENKITIFIREGVLEEVYGIEAYALCDYDVLESYECPICYEELEVKKTYLGREFSLKPPFVHKKYRLQEMYCPHCDIDWDDEPTYKEIHERKWADEKEV